jgi:hypothetical protein
MALGERRTGTGPDIEPGWDLVQARPAPGVTTEQPSERKPRAVPGTVQADRLRGVFGTGREKPAPRPDPGADRLPVKANQTEHQPGKNRTGHGRPRGAAAAPKSTASSSRQRRDRSPRGQFAKASGRRRSRTSASRPRIEVGRRRQYARATRRNWLRSTARASSFFGTVISRTGEGPDPSTSARLRCSVCEAARLRNSRAAAARRALGPGRSPEVDPAGVTGVAR